MRPRPLWSRHSHKKPKSKFGTNIRRMRGSSPLTCEGPLLRREATTHKQIGTGRFPLGPPPRRSPRSALNGRMDKRPYTEPAIADNKMGSNLSRTVWERRQGVATRIPVRPLSMEQPLLALLTLAAGPSYANFGSAGFGSCVRRTAHECPTARILHAKTHAASASLSTAKRLALIGCQRATQLADSQA